MNEEISAQAATQGDDSLATAERLLAEFEKQGDSTSPTAETTKAGDDRGAPEADADAAQASRGESDSGSEPTQAEPTQAEGGTDEETESFELPELIPEIANNPDALARVKEFERGVRKLVSRAKEKEAEIDAALPQVRTIASLAERFDDPATFAEAYRDLGRRLAEYHERDLSELLGSTPAKSPDVRTDGDARPLWQQRGFESQAEYDAAPEWEQAGYESAGELRLARKLEALTSQLESVSGTLRKTDEDAKRQEADKARHEYESKVVPKAIEELSKADNGWKVTPAMVLEAVTNLPKFRSEPAKAVRMWFSDERALHMAKVSAEESRTKAPDMVQASGQAPTGHQMPPPGKRSAADFMRLHGIT